MGHIRAIQELSTKYIASYEVGLSKGAEGAEPVVPSTRELRNRSQQGLITAMWSKEHNKRLVELTSDYSRARDEFRVSLLKGLDDLARKTASIP